VLTRSEKAVLLKRLRVEAGLGQRKLARLAKLEVRTIADMEHERESIGIKRARRLAKALGVDVSVLLFADPVPVGERNFESVAE
jgi:transcriptional regulator with XRE-family HTH domain